MIVYFKCPESSSFTVANPCIIIIVTNFFSIVGILFYSCVPVWNSCDLGDHLPCFWVE